MLEGAEAEGLVGELADQPVAFDGLRNALAHELDDATQRTDDLGAHRRVIELIGLERREVQVLDQLSVDLAPEFVDGFLLGTAFARARGGGRAGMSRRRRARVRVLGVGR